jgi:mono/diheme cytochrome c family protein
VTRRGEAAVVAVLVAAIAACGSPRRGEPIVGPLPLDDPAVARGRVAFAHTCAPCHPGGEGGLGPALNDKPAPAFLIKTQVRLGLGKMPGFDADKLPAETLDDIVEYLLALRAHDDPR